MSLLDWSTFMVGGLLVCLLVEEIQLLANRYAQRGTQRSMNESENRVDKVRPIPHRGQESQ